MKKAPISVAQVFDEYEKRFARVKLEMPFCPPVTDEQKNNVIDGVKKMLCFSDHLIPAITNGKVVSERDHGEYVEYQVTYQTWKNVYGVSTVMIPKTDRPVPVVLILCGHGKSGRLTESYSLMAHRLAKSKTAVIVPDNIGQGDREFMGHWKTLSPFYTGLTLQGLIVAETIALIRAIKAHTKFDEQNICACGNSGGGTLTLFLTALAPELKAVAISGYPSEFSYVLSKEKVHCACNLFKCGKNSMEMWEILSLFAPKPMLLSQGKNDDLIPKPLAQKNARKVKSVYALLGAQENFRFELTDTKHPWAEEDRALISEFLCKQLNLAPCKKFVEQDVIPLLENRSVKLPSQSIDVDRLVFTITGKAIPDGLTLQDVFPPTFKGERIDVTDLTDLEDGLDVMRIFAQMEFALKQI